MKLLKSAKHIAMRLFSALPLLLFFSGLVSAVAAPPGSKSDELRKAADHGVADAQFNLGICYGNGDGVPMDLSLAVKWFSKAAEQGHGGAQAALSRCYGEGLGVTRDDAVSLKWLQKAAEQGHPKSQFNLAACYTNGKGGVAKDVAVATKWLRKAAEQGEEAAQYVLGVQYFAGNGVPKDLVNAYMWLNLSNEGGLKDAGEALQTVASKMTSEQISDAKRLSEDWKLKKQQ